MLFKKGSFRDKLVRYMAKKPLIIGISGARGSFSEEAARTYTHKYGISNYKTEYLITVENVLSQLEKGSINLGIFPIENSNGGIVIETVHAMSKHNFHIKKIFEIDIHMNLLVKKGTKAGDIKKIASHDQALKQCRFYLKRRWPKAKIEEYPDTAKAAEDLAKGKLPKSNAVIASRAAAAIHKLTILEESIQDLKFNYTSFVVAQK
jgi:prephenate dehydratase